MKSRVSAVVPFHAVAIIGGLGALGKVRLLHEASAGVEYTVITVVALWILSPLAYRAALRFQQLLAPLVICGLLAAPIVLFPKVEKLHAAGRGSDQPDCIIVASRDMIAGTWPYDSSQMWSHNPLSCGPGWVGIQAPVVQSVGYRWDLCLISALCIGVVIWASGWNEASGFFALLALAPGLWIGAVDGTDFLPFGLLVVTIYVSAARSKASDAVLTVVLGLVAQFRVATLLLPGLFSGRIGRTRAILATSIAIVTEAAFLAWNPLRFTHDGPLHLFAKVTGKQISIPSAYLVTAFLLFGLTGTLLALRAGEKLPLPKLLLGYLLLIFTVPALANLVAEWKHSGFTLASLGLWEGGNWMVGCLPLCAFLLARHSSTSSSS